MCGHYNTRKITDETMPNFTGAGLLSVFQNESNGVYFALCVVCAQSCGVCEHVWCVCYPIMVTVTCDCDGVPQRW